MWAATDDYWLPTFIEKNVAALDKDSNIIGSISDVGLYSKFKSGVPIIDATNKSSKKFQYVLPTSTTFKKRIRTYLKFFQGSTIYAIFRTEIIKESFVPKLFWAIDLAIVLNTLKHGNLNVIDEILMYRYTPRKSVSLINYMLKSKIPISRIIFPEFSFTVWFLKNFGFIFFVKNFDIFIKLNLRGEYVIIGELLRILKRITYGQEKFW